MRKQLVIFILLSLIITAAGYQATDSLEEAVTFLIERETVHPKKGDREYAAEIAEAMKVAGREYNFDPYLLIACGKIESTFSPAVLSGKKEGKAGEIGILQCGKACARACPHFMDDIKGQALCGAHWLRVAYDTCKGKNPKKGDEWAALAYYAGSGSCNPEPDARPSEKGLTYRQKAEKRIRLRNRLRNRFAK